MNSKRVVVALFALTLGFSAFAESNRDRASFSSLVTRKTSQLAIRQEALRELGRTTNYEYLLDCVRRSEIRPLGPSRIDPAQQVAMVQVFEVDVVLTLAAGLGAGQCDSESTQKDLRAAARILQGKSSLADLIHISDFVVVAVARPAHEKIEADGFRSSFGFVVTESVKGRLQRGSKFIVRQKSGKNADGSEVSVSTDSTPVLGTKYMVVGSRSGYELEAAKHAKAQSLARPTVPVVLDYMIIDPASRQADAVRLATSPL